jgi:hypothetical protein
LNIDHVRNDGHLERRRHETRSTFYLRVLRSRAIGGRYQLLCFNCNLAKAHYGRCPHKAAKRRSA